MVKFNRNFMIIWLTQAISILGSSLTEFGMSVWIYEQTGEITPVAISVLCTVLPVLLLAPIAGEVADTFNRKWVIVLADMGAALTSLMLVLFLITGYFNSFVVYGIVLLSSGFNFFHTTAFQASITSMVSKEQLKSANGLLQITDSVSSLLMPVVAGIFYGFVGLAGMVVIDLVTFIISVCLLIVGIPSTIFAVLKVDKYSKEQKISRKERRQNTRKGFQFIFSRKGFTLLVFLFATINFLMNLSTVLLTPMALTIGESTQLGLIQSFGGAGMLVGSIIASLPDLKLSCMKRIKYCIGTVGICLVGMGMYTSIAGLAIGRFLCLMCVPISNVSAITMWQLKTPKELQGRVFAARSLIIRSFMPFAYIIVGPLTDSILPTVMDSAKPIGQLMTSCLGTILLNERLVFILAGCMLVIMDLFFFRNHHLSHLDDLPNCM